MRLYNISYLRLARPPDAMQEKRWWCLAGRMCSLLAGVAALHLNQEWWLDVVAHSCTGESFFIDATVRNPPVPKYRVEGHSCTQDGFACKVAVQDKQRRYPPKDGMRVTTAAMETYGYIGQELEDLLRTLHSMAQAEDVRRGRHPTNWMNRWTVALSMAVARHVAISIDEAIGTQNLRNQVTQS